VVGQPPLPPLLPPLATLPPLAALTPLLAADWIGFTLGGMAENLKKRKKRGVRWS